MKVIQIVPRQGLALYAALLKKEADIRKKGLGTCFRAPTKKRHSSKWRHAVRVAGEVLVVTMPSTTFSITYEKTEENRLVASSFHARKGLDETTKFPSQNS